DGLPIWAWQPPQFRRGAGVRFRRGVPPTDRVRPRFRAGRSWSIFARHSAHAVRLEVLFRFRYAMSSTHLLFVYGTLRRGFHHHGQLRGARFLGVVRTRPGYALVDFGPYPGLVEGARAIVGELYAVPSALVPALDAFEGDEY